jgi:hypothetical protein
MEDREMYCATCRADVRFDAPPCPDGHEDGCPELLCTRCGTAMLVAPLELRAVLRTGGSQVAPQQRRAA